MSVEDTNKQYTNMKSRWKQCRDCFEGQHAIHLAGEEYLPRLDSQSDDQYDSYKNRTRFFNAFKRTVSAMIGLSFRKNLIVKGDEELMLNINGTGDDIQIYAQNLVSELLITGSAGTLVDFPNIPDGLTVAQAESLNARPIFINYLTENIINWKYTTENNIRILKLIVLKESFQKDGDDEFNDDMEDRYRVLDIQDGKYRQRVFENNVAIKDEEIFPKMNGKYLSFIPFVHSGQLLPPLMDLADNNIKHYQLKADHTHGLRYVALPTPYITGVDKENAPDTIGPQKIWVLENPEAQVGYLEFTGQGLEALKQEVSAIENNMAQLGARLLDQDAVQPTTATAAAINNQNQNASLVNIINQTERDLNLAIGYLTEWSGKEETLIELSTDFLPQQLDPQYLTSLVDSWIKGAISKETLFYNLENGELIPDAINFEDEESLIESNLPPSGNIQG